MADFNVAYDEVIVGHEGGYVNDPNDPGGETICGVARRKRPRWAGWAIVDKVKKVYHSPREITEACAQEDGFNECLREFYKEEYWDIFIGDHWPDAMQANATEMFDSEVNTGRSELFVQRAVNLLNRNGKDWPDIVEDGAFGPATWAAVQACVEKRGAALLHRMQNQQQGEHYTSLMRKNPARYERYVGWFNRI